MGEYSRIIQNLPEKRPNKLTSEESKLLTQIAGAEVELSFNGKAKIRTTNEGHRVPW